MMNISITIISKHANLMIMIMINMGLPEALLSDHLSLEVSVALKEYWGFVIIEIEKDWSTSRYKGVTVKESKISRGLVSPAQRALKKIYTLAQFWPEKSHIRPMPKIGD